MRFILNLLIVILPWKIKRFLLLRLYHYDIHPSAHIGLSYIYPKLLVMEEGARIGHLNVAIHLDSIKLGKHASIARGNWITGFPTVSGSKHFAHDTERKSELIIGRDSAITKDHHIDCTNIIRIGDFVTIAGYRSQLLTHSIDIYECRQDSHPITIGDYCFVATGVIILGGSALPDHSVLGAGAVLNKKFITPYRLYAGVPAKELKEMPATAKYFTREVGFVY